MPNRPLRSDRIALSKHPAKDNPKTAPTALRPSTRLNKTLPPSNKSSSSAGKKPLEPSSIKTRGAAARTASGAAAAENTVAGALPSPRPALAVSPLTSELGTTPASPNARRNNYINPRKRAFDALKTGSSSRLPNGIRMKDGVARTEPEDAEGENVHATRPIVSRGSLHAQNHVSSLGNEVADASNAEDKRSLRSKAGGNRLKSDLATYFPNFEDVITGVPRDPEYVKAEEPIYIVDDRASQHSHAIGPSKSTQPKKSLSKAPVFEAFDIYSIVPRDLPASSADPLDESAFLKIHQRAERREKQLRNIEKERAQHEKGQLEQLLDSLQGPDWLRAMGVTGITDGARKEWEPKRDYFVREVRALLDKFRLWREAEKKLQHERELALAREQEKAEEDDEEEEYEEEDAVAGASRDDDSTLNGPSSSDVDALARHQLLLESKSAQKRPAHSRLGGRALARAQTLAKPPPPPPPPPKPLTSFFTKPHQRALALGKGVGSRQGNRRRSDMLAFGLPVPAVDVREFELPGELVSEEYLVQHARKRRRVNREKKEAEEQNGG